MIYSNYLVENSEVLEEGLQDKAKSTINTVGNKVGSVGKNIAKSNVAQKVSNVANKAANSTVGQKLANVPGWLKSHPKLAAAVVAGSITVAAARKILSDKKKDKKEESK